MLAQNDLAAELAWARGGNFAKLRHPVVGCRRRDALTNPHRFPTEAYVMLRFPTEAYVMLRILSLMSGILAIVLLLMVSGTAMAAEQTLRPSPENQEEVAHPDDKVTSFKLTENVF